MLEEDLTEQPDALELGTSPPCAFVEMSDPDLLHTLRLMVHEWMIGQAIRLDDPNDDAQFIVALGQLTTTQRYSLVHFIDARLDTREQSVRRPRTLSADVTSSLHALTSAVRRLIGSMT